MRLHDPTACSPTPIDQGLAPRPAQEVTWPKDEGVCWASWGYRVVMGLWATLAGALLGHRLQLYPKAQEQAREGAAGGPDGPGQARAPGIPAASAGSRMGRKPAPATSPRILWAAAGRTEALFVPAPTRHPPLAQGFEFPGGWGPCHFELPLSGAVTGIHS